MTAEPERRAVLAPATVSDAHTLSAAQVAARLGADAEHGLAAADAARRLAEVGPNALREAPRPTILQMLLEQFDDFVIRLLLVAAVVAAVVGHIDGEGYADSLAIIAIVVLNAVIGVVQARRAENALRALQAMAAPDAMVVRDGHRMPVPAGEVVPGDLVLLEAGNYVPADLRLVQAVNLRLDEASLTGESVAVRKDVEHVADRDTPRGDQRNMAFGGTVVSYGRGRGLVVATGMHSAIGQLAELIQSYRPEATPLQHHLEILGRTLGKITLAVCAIVFVVGAVRETPLAALSGGLTTYLQQAGDQLLILFMIAVSLAIAAVPEGLPAVVTIVLAIGTQRMARRNALVRRLPAVETLGSTTTICSDKTGTLTLSEMMVTQAELEGATLKVEGEGYAPTGSWRLADSAFDPTDSADLQLLATAATLASDAIVEHDGDRWRVIGDPTEGALVAFAARAGVDRAALVDALPRVAEIPFESERKRMTTIHRAGVAGLLPVPGFGAGGVIALVKGAPDLVLDRCTAYQHHGRPEPLDEAVRARIVAAHDDMARRALRILAVAYRVLDEVPAEPEAESVERDLVFAGLVGMIDPPRPEVRQAITRAQTAGVRTIMVTGDHRETAEAIARDLGLLRPEGKVVSGAELATMDDQALREQVTAVDVFARVSPEHKVRIVDALKHQNQIVAMTGDGVNDAPALKRAHIGVAMGLTGTDVSRETADMVLTDDNYASIVAAIEEGRTIYSNIRKFVFYLLSCNVGEILIIFTAMLLALAPEAPLLPIHLLWLNLVTDGLPALALGVEAGDPNVMARPPRQPGQSILTRNLWALISVQAIVDALATLLAFVWAYDGPETLRFAQTVAFATLVTAELLRAYTSRSQRRSILQMGFFTNRWMVVATASSFLLLLAALYAPGMRDVFKTVPLGGAEWLAILGFAVLPAIGAEVAKAVLRWRQPLRAAAAA